MQRYQSPSIFEARSLADSLLTSYKKAKGENPERLAFIKLLADITQKTHISINEQFVRTLIAGACVFEIEKIEAEYPHSSPILQKGWVYNTGSRLYTDVVNYLHVNDENKLNDDERLIHLLKFYEFVNKTFTDDDVQGFGWKSKNELLDQIKDKLKVIKKREFQKIKAYTHSEPTLAAMRKKIDKTFPDYQMASSSRWWKNSKRLKSSLFVDFINKTAAEMYNQCEFYQATDNENLKNINFLQWKKIISGAGIFPMLEIDPEYRIRSATNSYHYRQSASLVGARKLKDVERERRIIGLRALSSHLTNLKELKGYDALIKEWKAKGMEDVDAIQKRVEEYIIEEQKEHPSKVREAITYGVSNTAQYGIDFALTRYPAVALVSMPTVATALAGAAMGPIGLVVYSTAGVIVATQLARLVRDKLVPQAVASIYTKILEKIGDKVGNATSSVVVGTFSVTASGIKRFMGYCKEKEKDTFLEDWIYTLLALPDDVMSQDEKKEIREVLGIEADEVATMQLESTCSLARQ